MQKLGSNIIMIVTVICIAAYIGVFIGRISSDSSFSKDTTKTETNTHAETTEYTLNINTADLEELMKLPGMNKALAEEIITYRQIIGNFIAIKELQNLEFMTDEIYFQIKDYLQTGGTQ